MLFGYVNPINESFVRIHGHIKTLSFIMLFNGVLLMDVANGLYLFYYKLGGQSIIYGCLTEGIATFIICLCILYFSDWYRIKKKEI